LADEADGTAVMDGLEARTAWGGVGTAALDASTSRLTVGVESAAPSSDPQHADEATIVVPFAAPGCVAEAGQHACPSVSASICGAAQAQGATKCRLIATTRIATETRARPAPGFLTTIAKPLSRIIQGSATRSQRRDAGRPWADTRI
jgi:hypothetical protein